MNNPFIIADVTNGYLEVLHRFGITTVCDSIDLLHSCNTVLYLHQLAHNNMRIIVRIPATPVPGLQRMRHILTELSSKGLLSGILIEDPIQIIAQTAFYMGITQEFYGTPLSAPYILKETGIKPAVVITRKQYKYGRWYLHDSWTKGAVVISQLSRPDLQIKPLRRLPLLGIMATPVCSEKDHLIVTNPEYVRKTLVEMEQTYVSK